MTDRTKFSRDDGLLYDVVAVDIETQSVLWVMPRKSRPSAEAAMMTAIARQGTKDRIFGITERGLYVQGDEWKGDGT